MSFFNQNQPILRRKDFPSNAGDLLQLRCIDFRTGNQSPFSGIYTCLDQTMALWGMIVGIIFLGAQFLPISWLAQSAIWSILTAVGTVAMAYLTYPWVKLRGLRWLLLLWIFLMSAGTVLTDLAIACGWGAILINLCPLWLGLSAAGYCLTGWAMRSRAFFVAAALHGVAMAALPIVGGWQFLATGLIMMGNLLAFAEGQWDMLLPDVPEVEQQAVNLTEGTASQSPAHNLKWRSL